MQKKIIALAIASALTAPALAFADVTPYAQANLSVDRVNDGNSPRSTTNQLVSNYSYIGLKGSEDMGGGLAVVGKIEGSVGMDGSSNNLGTSLGTSSNPSNSSNNQFTTTFLFNRDTYLGLSSATMGTVVAGRHETPYMMATRKLDMFGDTVAADTRSSMGVVMMGGGHDIYVSNAVAYISPSMSGFSVAAASVFGAETAATNATKGSLYSLAGMYEQGPIYAALAYDNIKAGSTGSGDLGTGTFGAVDDKATAFKVGGSYTVDAFAINAVIERLTNTIASTGQDLKNTDFYLAGKFNITSTDDVKLAYTKRGDTTGNTDNAKQYALGYDHAMARNTSVYALYSKVTQNAAGASDPSTLSAGIKHSF
jgi:predicted porin